ncbi:MAG: FAD-binding oxidoreductase [Anaerolineae bacterium]|nr:FAD-binding oxidoreductase [Anaerolineae bacterium]
MATQNIISIAHDDLMTLQSRLSGTVLTPDDPGYDAARMNWNVAIDQHPALIVMAKTASDVAQAVRFAVAANLQIAVKATGHGAVLPADNCLLVVTANMQGVSVDAQQRTATIQAGVQWGAVLEAAQRAGLAPLLGSSPTVGAIGYTLGGGLGWLARKHGLAVDSVRTFQIVTPAGDLVEASASSNADLYWALRGGGGNFGVVVEMTIRLYPVTTVYAGNLYYPVSLAREVYARYREWVASAPNELTSAVVIMNYPPLPQLPEFLRGQTFIQVRGCYAGAVEDGEALLAYWRDWHEPVIDDFKAMPFSESARISSDPVDPMPSCHTGAWLHSITDEAIEALVEMVPAQGGPGPIIFAEIRHSGGAIAEGESGNTAFSLRDAAFILECIGIAPTPEAKQGFTRLTDALKARMASALTGGIYLNFASAEDARQRAQDAFSPEALARLRLVKAAYDPADRFDHSFNLNT